MSSSKPSHIVAVHGGTQRRATGHPIESSPGAEAVQMHPANTHRPRLVDALLHGSTVAMGAVRGKATVKHGLQHVVGASAG